MSKPPAGPHPYRPSRHPLNPAKKASLPAADFEMAIRIDAKENGFITPLGEKMIQDNGDGLSRCRSVNRKSSRR